MISMARKQMKSKGGKIRGGTKSTVASTSTSRPQPRRHNYRRSTSKFANELQKRTNIRETLKRGN